MSKIADFRWGWIGTYDDNEIEIVSTISDPPKVRLAVQAGKVESNLGGVTFNIRRDDGRHEEYGYIMGRLTADKQAGAIYFATRGPGDSQAKERAYLDHTGAYFRVPMIGSSAVGVTDTMWAPGGLSFTQQQADGNFVTYVTSVPFSKAGEHVKAVWSAWTGRL